MTPRCFGSGCPDPEASAGDVARARELFRWILAEEPEFADAAERVSALS